MKYPTNVALLALALILVGACREAGQSKSKEDLRIVKKALWRKGDVYEVRGIIHNPRTSPAEEVKITIQFQATDISTAVDKAIDLGSKSAVINYLPPGASVDFDVSIYVGDSDDRVVRTGEVQITEK
jgi:hypothetical protein